MNEEPLQKGGVDPGLAALIAALLTGSVGSYGYLANKETPQAMAEARLESQITAANEKIKQLNEITSENSSLKANLRNKEAELVTLKKELESLKKTASVKSDLEEIFKNATAEVLNRAVEPTLEKLKSQYPSVKTDGELKKALQYPGSYQGRLMRMSLYDFYYKRVKWAFEKDMKGGKKRRRAGGATGETSEPSTPTSIAPEIVVVPANETPFPDYDTFAKIYTDVILASTTTFEQDLKKKLEEKKTEADKKKDEAAVKSAKTLADKLQKVIADAEKEIPNYHSLVGKNEDLMARETALYADLEDAKNQIEEPLRLLTTEAEWNTKKDDAKRILEEIPQKVKSYAKAAKEAPKPTAEPVVVPEPSVDQITTVQSPLFLKQEADRKKQSFEEQKAEVQGEGPSRLTRKKTRKTFGGKLRKRTLKKRRGGK